MSTTTVTTTEGLRQRRRRLSAPPAPSSTSATSYRIPSITCSSSTTLAALDLTSASPTTTLASLRFLVLTYLETLERSLDSLSFTPTAATALDLLAEIRSDVVSRLPHFTISADPTGLEAFVRTHWPAEFALSLPKLPSLSLAQYEKQLDDAREGFHDLDLEFQPSYYAGAVETLSNHLATLHKHLEGMAPTSYSFPFAPVAEGLEALVTEAKAMLESAPVPTPTTFASTDGKLKPPPLTLRSRSRSLIADVCSGLSGLEANMEALADESSELVFSALASARMNLTSLSHEISDEFSHFSKEFSDFKTEIEHEIEEVIDEVKRAMMRSFEGVKLIGYTDLPHEWKNNPFVVHGYRFIPVERWGLILRSVFEAHNETLNIHTHFIPFLIWFSNLVLLKVSAPWLEGVPQRVGSFVTQVGGPVVSSVHSVLPLWALGGLEAVEQVCVSSFQSLVGAYAVSSAWVSSLPTPPFPFSITPLIQQRMLSSPSPSSSFIIPATFSSPSDPIEFAFISFSLLCLLASSLWHTMSGCADLRSMEFCARVDYVGIGWLISATVATVVWYGFGTCHPNVAWSFLGVCLATGICGNIFPFMKWFNMHEYRLYRIAFFLSMAISGLGPMIMLGVLHSRREAYDFVSPIFPSLLSYVIGLLFYATHTPERFLPVSVRRKLDVVGGSSHAIWHCFIVLAVSQHKAAIGLLKEGVSCKA
ncbi:hypothetical protein MD484_g437, partial [Candolleomyces efflorescens]